MATAVKEYDNVVFLCVMRVCASFEVDIVHHIFQASPFFSTTFLFSTLHVGVFEVVAFVKSQCYI